jgi:hypothetical protein
MLILDGIFLYVTVRSSRFAKSTLSRWEFFTAAIDFDWNYLTTKKKIKWPTFVRPGSSHHASRGSDDVVQLYLTCRVCSLGVVICNFIGDNVTRQINCQV